MARYNRKRRTPPSPPPPSPTGGHSPEIGETPAGLTLVRDVAVVRSPKPNHLVYEFATWSDYIDHATNSKSALTGWDRGSEHYDPSFNHTVSWEAFRDLELTGWKDGAQKVSDLAQAIFTRVSTMIRRPSISRNVIGDMLDPALYVMGVPDPWYVFDEEIVDGIGRKVFRLVYNQSTSCGVSTEVMIARGSVIAALVNVLELAGHSVEVLLVNALDYSTKPAPINKLEWSVPVKYADQPLSIPRLALALAHPDSFRRLGFRIYETVFPDKSRGQLLCNYGNYGKPTDTDFFRDRADILIDKALYGNDQWTNHEKAVNWVLDQLKAQGIEIED